MATGHRSVAHQRLVADRLVIVLEGLGAGTAISGGAAGADRLFAEAALRCGTALHLMLPNRHYRSHYPGAVSDEMVAAAAEVSLVVERPEVADWRQRWDAERWWLDNFERNAAMIGAADVAVVVSPRHPLALREEKKGGTAHCVKLLARSPLARVVWVPDDPALPVVWVRLDAPRPAKASKASRPTSSEPPLPGL